MEQLPIGNRQLPVTATTNLPAVEAPVPTDEKSKLRKRLFLAMVAVLPLHTVFLSAWISWKPYLVIVILIAVFDLTDWVRTGEYPWNPIITGLFGVSLVVVLIGWPAAEYLERYAQLTLALAIGALVLLTTERSLRQPGMFDRMLRVAVWTGALMGLTAVVFELIAIGVFGSTALSTIGDLPGIFRVAKPAYLDEGFFALTNWHQDPGYSAAWANLWIVLVLAASARGLATGRRWLDGIIVGGLAFNVLMAFSRTGWAALPIVVGVAAFLLVRSGQITFRYVAELLGVAVLTVALLTSIMLAVDPEDVGGDLSLQFDFRLSQGWELLSDITGLFETSEPFEDRFAVSEQRADVWPEYVDMFRENPWLGVGLGVGWQTNSLQQEPHNLVLELLAELGIVGALVFAALLAVVLLRGGGAVGFAVLAAALLPFISQTVLFEPAWWFAAGILISGASAHENEINNASTPSSYT
jgi:O-antigen ligase